MRAKFLLLSIFLSYSVAGSAQYNICQLYYLINNPSASIFDSGGADNNYSSNTDCYKVIKPDCADTIFLSFTTFDLEEGFDSLLVFDGSYSYNELLGSFTGDDLPPIMKAVSGSMRIEFYSNDTIEGMGFAANWSTVDGPDLEFEINAFSTHPDGIFMEGYQIYFSTSLTGSGTGEWEIIDGDSVFSEFGGIDNVGDYYFQTSGDHEIVYNYESYYGCLGTDTLFLLIEENPDATLIPNYLEDGTHWCGAHYQGTEYNDYYYEDHYTTYINGDTIIDDLDFKRVYHSGLLNTHFYPSNTSYVDEYNYLRAYLRQDGEKIYRYYVEEDSVVVLYDFSLEIGDTIPYGGIDSEFLIGDEIFFSEGGDVIYTVTNIDSLQILGRWHKRFWFTTQYGQFYFHPYYFIEGIGHPLGFLEQFRYFTEWEGYYNHRYTNADSLTFVHEYSSTEFGSNGDIYWCDYALPEPPGIWFDPGTYYRFSGGYNFYEGYVTVTLELDTIMYDQQATKFRVDRTYYNYADSLIENEFESFEYMYEDSDHVYQLIGETFEVLYDFTVQVGDTVTTYLGDYYLPYTSCEITGQSLVTEVGVDTINGASLRYYVIETLNESPVTLDGKIVEKVANVDNYMFAQPMCDIFEEYKGQFRCYEDNYFGSYVNEWTSSCESLYLSIEEKQINESFSLFPNPTKGTIKITSEGNFEIYSIRIYSIGGVIMLNENLGRTKEYVLDLGDLENGMYLIEVENKENDRLIKRFIKI